MLLSSPWIKSSVDFIQSKIVKHNFNEKVIIRKYKNEEGNSSLLLLFGERILDIADVHCFFLPLPVWYQALIEYYILGPWISPTEIIWCFQKDIFRPVSIFAKFKVWQELLQFYESVLLFMSPFIVILKPKQGSFEQQPVLLPSAYSAPTSWGACRRC